MTGVANSENAENNNVNEQTQLLESNNNNDNTQTDISVTDTNVISPSLAELEEQSGLQDYLATHHTETDPLLAANNKSPMQDLRIVILTMVMKMKMRESITMTIT